MESLLNTPRALKRGPHLAKKKGAGSRSTLMQAKTVLPQSIPRSRYIGQTKSGKAPAARDLTKVLVAMALGLYRVKVSTRY